MVLMFIGRVGPLAIVSSVIGERRRMNYGYPKTDLLVG
jgi:hypothetical protein